MNMRDIEVFLRNEGREPILTTLVKILVGGGFDGT